MSQPSKSIYHYETTVSADDIDELQHANNIVYLRWVQEAAAAHWSALSNEAINQKYIWVVMRHEIDYLRSAHAGDQLSIQTWVERNEGAKSWRHTILYNSHSNQPIASAITTWCLLDAVTRRPRRIDEEIASLFKLN